MPLPLILAAGAAGASTIGAGLGWLLGNKAAGYRHDAAIETERRRDAGNQVVLGQAAVNAGASGVTLDPESSMAKYLADMGSEFRREHSMNVLNADRGMDLEKEGNALQAFSTVTGSLFKFGGAAFGGGGGGPTIK